MDIPVKPVFWIARTLRDLKKFPDAVQQLMGFALWEAQTGGQHVDAKPLKGFGGNRVLEIVTDDEGNTFRGVYTVKFAGAVYVLHVFQKKSKKGSKTPQPDIELIRKRLKLAAEHHAQWYPSQQKEDNDDETTSNGRHDPTE